MKKIIIASDSFKGSLSSLEVAGAIEEGIRLELPGAEIVKIPVADGGEGTMRVLVEALRGEYISCTVNDPLMRAITSEYGIVYRHGKKTAIIDAASAAGLTLLTPGERDPLVATTYGTGQLIADAYKRGCRHYIIGIGGSATNDAGKGMLRALGYRFRDVAGNELAPGGASLNELDGIDVPEAHKAMRDCEFTIICDVDNPLFGTRGAAHVFAPQKGASQAAVCILDAGLRRFAACVKSQFGVDVADVPGAGAAGGLGAAFITFFNAILKPGIATVLHTLCFEEYLTGSDLVITGEGKMDEQTLMGKVPQGVLALARKHGVPVVALGGAVENHRALADAGFLGVFCIQSSAIPLAEAIKPRVTVENLKQTASQIVRLLSFPKSRRS